jgi:D-glycero-D-manno-heptose 1,7-bisphosphate phosphatase
MSNKAVFLDRDGTIIIDKCYLHDPNEVEYLPGAIEGLKLLQKKGYLLFIVTNQSGIGRGYYKKLNMDAVHAAMQNDLVRFGLKKYDDIVYCPHTPDDSCNCRKPSPFLIEKIIKKWNLKIENCYMIGDKEIDALAGINAKIQGVLITINKDSSFTTFPNLLEFAENIP